MGETDAVRLEQAYQDGALPREGGKHRSRRVRCVDVHACGCYVGKPHACGAGDCWVCNPPKTRGRKQWGPWKPRGAS